jgi:hypothetical protein
MGQFASRPIGYFFRSAMAANFSTKVDQTSDATVIYVRGEIDIATRERLRDPLESHLGPKQSVNLLPTPSSHQF